MKNETNPSPENGSSVGNKMEAKILRSLMRSSKWHYCFNASCSKAQECAAFLSGKILIHDEAFYKELFYDEVVPTIRPDARYDDQSGSKGSEKEAGSFYPCTQFCRPCMERKVWGFSQFYAEVKGHDTLPLRHQLMSLLGAEPPTTVFIVVKNCSQQKCKPVLLRSSRSGDTTPHPMTSARKFRA